MRDDVDMPADLASLAAAHGCEVVDLRFTDMLGRWLHVSLWARGLGSPSRAIPVAGSSVAGWGRLAGSDFVLRPDPTTAYRDPFATRPTLVVIGELHEPGAPTPWRLDPRATARRAVTALRAAGVADEIRLGFELEFYLFESARFLMSPTRCFFDVRERDSLDNTRRRRRRGESGHRMLYPALHLAGAPLDADEAWRLRLVERAERLGLGPAKHQHEAGPGQQELGLGPSDMISAIDRLQAAKQLVHRCAGDAGKVATFMPKPLAYQPGSGLHVNLSLWRNGRPRLAGAEGDRLRRAFLGGVFAHGRALCALTNPSTNGFRRLAALHGASAPLGYGEGNRAAAVRLPAVTDAAAARIEFRFPDATANPYLAAAAIAMAGLDGIRRGLDAGPPMSDDPRGAGGEDDVRRRPAQGLALDLGEAIVALAHDDAFLRADSVFDPLLIETLLAELNRQVRVTRALPHPNEYYLSFSA